TQVAGSVPHPKGEIAVSLVRRGVGLDAEVRLPEGVEGELVWAGERRPLGPGLTRLRFGRAPRGRPWPTLRRQGLGLHDPRAAALGLVVHLASEVRDARHDRAT